MIYLYPCNQEAKDKRVGELVTRVYRDDEQLILKDIGELIHQHQEAYLAKANLLLDKKTIHENQFRCLVEYSVANGFVRLKISQDQGASFQNLAEQFLGSDRALYGEILVEFFAQSQARLKREYDLD